MTEYKQTLPPKGLLAVISPSMVDDCIERTARKRHYCHTHQVIVARAARNDDAPGWATQTYPACSHTIEPGDQYVECMSEAHAFESGSRYCSGCVSTGIPLGSAEVEADG